MIYSSSSAACSSGSVPCRVIWIPTDALRCHRVFYYVDVDVDDDDKVAISSQGIGILNVLDFVHPVQRSSPLFPNLFIIDFKDEENLFVWFFSRRLVGGRNVIKLKVNLFFLEQYSADSRLV